MLRMVLALHEHTKMNGHGQIVEGTGEEGGWEGDTFFGSCLWNGVGQPRQCPIQWDTSEV